MALPGTDARAEHRDGVTPPEADVVHGRERLAGQRDQAADKRDELAVQRDREADIADQRVLQIESTEEVLDTRALRVQELRARGRLGRQRAAGSRELAKRDRTLAGADRQFGKIDRLESKRDRNHASTDELTGARRRGVGLEDLQREIDRARRTQATLIAAYVDVDGLKAVNDQHGHQAGDEVLKAVVAGLRRDMRPYDLLVRLGGDEFLCVMSGVSCDEARRRFERLGAELAVGPTVRSFSIGLGELRTGDGAQELVDRADQDLLANRARTQNGPAAA
jgi:diguanylate cyclase (GGDEF)-like protein